MKAVLISINPKWCELIACGEKTIEVRKSAPKLETPFKCYIYCTAHNSMRTIFVMKDGDENYGEIYHGPTVFAKCETGSVTDMFFKRKKVIGEFVCDRIDDLRFVPKKYFGKPAGTFEELICEQSCLSVDEIKSYAKGKAVYGWHSGGRTKKTSKRAKAV